jgi:hypothetical protein
MAHVTDAHHASAAFDGARLCCVVLVQGVTADGSPVDDGGSMHSQLGGPYIETLARDWGLEFRDGWDGARYGRPSRQRRV